MQERNSRAGSNKGASFSRTRSPPACWRMRGATSAKIDTCRDCRADFRPGRRIVFAGGLSPQSGVDAQNLVERADQPAAQPHGVRHERAEQKPWWEDARGKGHSASGAAAPGPLRKTKSLRTFDRSDSHNQTEWRFMRSGVGAAGEPLSGRRVPVGSTTRRPVPGRHRRSRKWCCPCQDHSRRSRRTLEERLFSDAASVITRYDDGTFESSTEHRSHPG